ncbi:MULTISPECIES: mannan chain length control protein LmeA [unclassified Mycobacterium]|uniref:mannan chain length control protein LmeA n=1 Tax=unclassified Mycobacterium TaxID=2642494 RepID=UPI000991F872|nr:MULTISPECIES: mannan chain length control protein LmeA [unclassified Mycobacterium]
MQMRKPLIATIAAVCALAIAATSTDFGCAIYAEYRLSRTLRAEANLSSDPSVAILVFPFIPQALAHRYKEVEIKAHGVDHAETGKATLEGTLHGIDISQASWLIRPDSPLRVDRVESRIIIDSNHLGRFMGINDLAVEPPPKEQNDATGGTTESGISTGTGLLFTGTPKTGEFQHKVTVSVDVSVGGPAKTDLQFVATSIVTGPGTADRDVPEDQQAGVFAAFTKVVPRQKLPFAIEPTTVGARGSDVIIEGIAKGVTISLDAFKQS